MHFVVTECCFTSTETVGLLGTGAQDGHLDFTQFLRLLCIFKEKKKYC